MKKLLAIVMAVVFVTPLFAHDAVKIRDLEREILNLKKAVVELEEQNMELEDALIKLERKVYGKQVKKRFYAAKVRPTPVPTATPVPAISVTDVKARPEKMAGRNRTVSYTVSAVNNTNSRESNISIDLIFKDASDRVLHIEALKGLDFNRREEKKISGEIRMRPEKAAAITAVTAEIK